MSSHQSPAGWFCVGVAAALLGLLPWLVTGARLPLQNLWTAQTLPDQMPIAALPLSQYHLIAIMALLLAPALPLGLLLRHQPAAPAAAAIVGMSAVQLVAVVQASVAVASGIGRGKTAAAYLAVLIAVQSVGLLLAHVGAWSVRTPSRVGAALGVGLLGLFAPGWITAWWLGLPLSMPPELAWVTRLGAPVLIGLTLGWCGIASAARALLWVTELLLLWVVPAGTTALLAVASSRALLRTPEQVPAALHEYLQAALGPAGGGPERLIVSVSLGSIGLLLGRLKARWSPIQSIRQ